jgi:hypothetical protein
VLAPGARWRAFGVVLLGLSALLTVVGFVKRADEADLRDLRTLQRADAAVQDVDNRRRRRKAPRR